MTAWLTHVARHVLWIIQREDPAWLRGSHVAVVVVLVLVPRLVASTWLVIVTVAVWVKECLWPHEAFHCAAHCRMIEDVLDVRARGKYIITCQNKK